MKQTISFIFISSSYCHGMAWVLYIVRDYYRYSRKGHALNWSEEENQRHSWRNKFISHHPGWVFCNFIKLTNFGHIEIHTMEDLVKRSLVVLHGTRTIMKTQSKTVDCHIILNGTLAKFNCNSKMKALWNNNTIFTNTHSPMCRLQ